MIIRDKIEEKSLYFVEQNLPNVTFYEIYLNTRKIFQIKNNFDNVIETAEICISNKLQNENNNISQNLNYLEQIKQVSNVFDKETKLVELQKNITMLEIATNKIKIINI